MLGDKDAVHPGVCHQRIDEVIEPARRRSPGARAPGIVGDGIDRDNLVDMLIGPAVPRTLLPGVCRYLHGH